MREIEHLYQCGAAEFTSGKGLNDPPYLVDGGGLLDCTEQRGVRNG